MSQQIAVSQLCQRHNTKYYYQRQWHILLFQSVYLYARVLHVCLCMCMCGQSGPRGAKSPHFDFYLPINVWPSVEQLKQPTTDHKWLVVVACRAVVVAVWRRPRLHGHCVRRAVVACTANIVNKILVVLEKYVYCRHSTSSRKCRLSIIASCVSMCVQWLLQQIIFIDCAVMTALHALNGPTPNRRITSIKLSRIFERLHIYLYI